MKVPKMYKSSDRYNAGTDVIYNDESKLQYAPFIYATTESGDNGGDGGDDEEGDEGMVVTITTNETLGVDIGDKTFDEIESAMKAGKSVIFVWGGQVAPVINLNTTTDQILIMLSNQYPVAFEKDADTGYPYYVEGD